MPVNSPYTPSTIRRLTKYFFYFESGTIQINTERSLLFISRYPDLKTCVIRPSVLPNACRYVDSPWILAKVNRTVTDFQGLWLQVPLLSEKNYYTTLRRFYEFCNKCLLTQQFHFQYTLNTAALKSRMWQTAMQHETAHFNVLTLEKSDIRISWFLVILKVYLLHSSTWHYTSIPTYAFMACAGTNLLYYFKEVSRIYS